MASEGRVKVGQLLREQHRAVGIVAGGFGLYQGSAVARRGWGDSMFNIKVPKAIYGSWEHALHLANNGQNRLLLMNKVMEKNVFFQQ